MFRQRQDMGSLLFCCRFVGDQKFQRQGIGCVGMKSWDQGSGSYPGLHEGVEARHHNLHG
jgi:hypothetical protein